MGQKGKTERRERRASVGPLSSNRVTRHTRARCFDAADRFLTWVIACGLGLGPTWDELEWQLSEYVECLWQEGEPEGLAADTLSGSGHFIRRAVGMLALGSSCLYGADSRYRTEHLLCQRTWPWLSRVGVCSRGDSISPLWSTVVFICRCVLRRCSRFLATFSPSAVILKVVSACRRRKLRSSVGLAKSTVSMIPWSGVSSWKRSRPLRTAKYSSSRGPRSGSFFATGVAALGLTSRSYRPYSIRRGGATHDFLVHHDLQRSLLRGRWSSLRTANINITDGAALIQELKLTPAMHRNIEWYRSVFLERWREFVKASCE